MRFFRSADIPIRRIKKVETLMTPRRPLYEKEGKIIFLGPEPGTLVQRVKNPSLVIGGPVAQGETFNKGALNNRVSELFMTRLNDLGIPTRFVRRLNMREQLVKQVDFFPLKFVVRNCAAGRLAKRLRLPEGLRLPQPLCDYFYRFPDGDESLVTEEQIVAFGWAGRDDLEEISALALRVNDFLYGQFLAIGYRLFDFNLEFGEYYNEQTDEAQIVIAEEISLNHCRLLDLNTGELLGKHKDSETTDAVLESYVTLAKRLGALDDGGPIDLKQYKEENKP